MSKFIELEIKTLLDANCDLNAVVHSILESFQNSPENLSAENVDSFAKFLLNANAPESLIQFVLQNFQEKNFPIPWPYFLEALGLAQYPLNERSRNALIEGIEEQKAEMQAARSLKLKGDLPQLGKWRMERNYKIQSEYISKKRQHLDQLVTYKLHQLFEQETKLLNHLQNLYPNDSEIERYAKEHKERHLLTVLEKRAPKHREIKTDDLITRDPEIEKSQEALSHCLLEQVNTTPDMAIDFAILALTLENYDTTLQLLSAAEETSSAIWLQLEVQLRKKHYIDLLTNLVRVETLFAHEPETFFATAYLRAQALWGLGQKHAAIEVLEGLIAARPHYRAASALLTIWSGQ